MMGVFERSVRDRPLVWFFALAYAVYWAFWLPAVLANVGWIGPVPSRHLHLAGGLGPMVSAIVVTSLAEGQPALARLAKRCISGRVWIIIATLIPAGLFFTATTSIVVFSGAAIEWSNVGRSTDVWAASSRRIVRALVSRSAACGHGWACCDPSRLQPRR